MNQNNQNSISQNEDLTNEWAAEVEHEEIAVEQMDAAMVAFADARTEYEKLDRIAKDAFHLVEEKKLKMLSLLNRAGKKSWEVDGLGKITKSIRHRVKGPKDPEKKAEMLKHFRSLGPDEYLHYVSINAATLNSYYKQAIDNNPEFELPGIDAPEAIENISLRRKK